MLKTLLLLWWCLFCRFWTVNTCFFLYNKVNDTGSMILHTSDIGILYVVVFTRLSVGKLGLHSKSSPNPKKAILHACFIIGEVWQIQESCHTNREQNAFTKHCRFVNLSNCYCNRIDPDLFVLYMENLGQNFIIHQVVFAKRPILSLYVANESGQQFHKWFISACCVGYVSESQNKKQQETKTSLGLENETCIPFHMILLRCFSCFFSLASTLRWC